MPRIYNYFDDIIGSDLGLQNDFVGQRLAIREFNEQHRSENSELLSILAS